MAEDPVQFLVDVLKTYSPSGSEAKVARLISARMKRMRYSKVRLDSAGNVIGEVGRGRIRILLCGHVDTVPGKLRVTVKDGRVAGRGACDAKSPLCALIVAGSRFRDQEQIHLTVAGVVREESDSLGVKTLLNGSKPFDYAVFGEPSGAGRITVGYRGRVGVHFAAKTPGGHASSPWAYTSAFDASLLLLEDLREYERKHTIKDDRFRSLSVSVTIMKAGTFHNVVPNRASTTVDVRVPPGMSVSQVERDLRAIADRFAKKSGGVEMKVAFDEGTEPYEADVDTPIVRAFQRAVILKLKKGPVLVRKTGTGDMNTLAAGRGTQCVTYGPGNPILGHTSDEYVLVDDYLKSIEVITEAIHQIRHLSQNRG